MLEHLRFELLYRLKRPATYLYFLILFVICFVAMVSDNVSIGTGGGKVFDNAPIQLALITSIMGFIAILIISGIMGVPIVRDFQHKTASLIYTTPTQKWKYLSGRFSGSFLITALILLGIPLGLLMGHLSPWADADNLAAINAWHYFQPYLVHLLPTAFFAGCIFFLVGALSRNMLIVFIQGILFIVLYMIADSFTSDLDNKRIASIFDPFGLSPIAYETQYWTVAEQNTKTIGWFGAILLNKLLWLGTGILALISTFVFFNFNLVRDKKSRRTKVENTSKQKTNQANIPVPAVTQNLGFATQIKHIWSLTKMYFKTVVKSIPFLAIVLMGIVLIFVNSSHWGQMYGTFTLPATYQMVSLISSFNLFFWIIIIYFSGELIWRERDVQIGQIIDATPVKNSTTIISKILSMIIIFIVLFGVLILCGVCIQALRGYFNFELGVYFKSLFLRNILGLILFTVLAFFIHIIVNNKFVGHALNTLFFMGILFAGQLGIEHNMLIFGSGGLGTFSDMNQLGHYLNPFNWFKSYWFAFAGLLFAGIVLFANRGAESVLKSRLRVAKLRITKPMLTFGFVSLAMFTLSGCFIYYNTNVLNSYINSDKQELTQANYEKELKQFQWMAKPKITATNVAIDFYPEQRAFNAKGYYIIENKTNEVIQDIHIQKAGSDDVTIKQLTFEGGSSVKKEYEDFGYTIHQLTKPMQPGDQKKLEWDIAFKTKGFVEGGSDVSVVFNGTFINNLVYFPTIGYHYEAELVDDDTRKEYNLAPKPDVKLAQDDPRGLNMNLFGDSSDYIDFEIVLSTSSDQIAIAPGYLQKEWEENDRKYFHYKMDKKMANFYAMMTAKYEIEKDTWISPSGEEMPLEIYYHQGHEYNLDRMFAGMKDALTYNSINFSPFQFRQMRIIEFPRYRTFAQSFANTVPFSEGIGFMLDTKKNDIDMTYYVTAHEIAHQWWGHQVMEADVQGGTMLSETLSQYSALMVMKQTHTTEQMQEFLKHELDQYLSGRTFERKKEYPITHTSNQQYIHYNKGSLLMYGLQDLIGEDKVNAALKDYVGEYYYGEAPYPTSNDLLRHLSNHTPDSLQYVFDEWFKKITLFENKTNTATFTKLGEDEYEVSIDVSSIKYEADSFGNETKQALHDWIDLGVYARVDGEEKLIYREKHKVTKEQETFTIKVDKRPIEAGIDPLNILIDRNPTDNVKTVSKKEDT